MRVAEPRTLYRYGALAWVWRAFLLGGLGGVVLLVGLALRSGASWPLGVAVPLALPLVLAGVVAVRIDRQEDGRLAVTTLSGWRRRIARERLGRPRVRRSAQGTLTRFDAPRAWIPVRGGLPLYVDLLADIPDRTALRDALRLPRDAWARGV
ncbi:MAG: hypothetical protein R3E98_20755 [Gemmatimonadota bacterium]